MVAWEGNMKEIRTGDKGYWNVHQNISYVHTTPGNISRVKQYPVKSQHRPTEISAKCPIINFSSATPCSDKLIMWAKRLCGMYKEHNHLWLGADLYVWQNIFSSSLCSLFNMHRCLVRSEGGDNTPHATWYAVHHGVYTHQLSTGMLGRTGRDTDIGS